jgi:hypothetical protein
LQRAETAYKELNSDAFITGVDGALLDLSCLSQVVPTDSAAHVHRLRGLRAFARGDTQTALASFSSGNAADPGGSLAPDLVPEGHQIWTLAAQPPSGDTERLHPPAKGFSVWLDGQQTRDRATDRPLIAQVTAAGVVVSTAYIAAGESMPAYPESSGPKIRRAALWTGTALTATTSVVLYGVARSNGSVLRTGDVPNDWTRDDVESRRSGVNAMTTGSIAAMIAAGGLGFAAVLP